MSMAKYKITPEMYKLRIESAIVKLRQAELSLQKAKDLMDKRLETGYEHYQEQSINAMCDALANIKQQDVKLAELGLCEIKYI